MQTRNLIVLAGALFLSLSAGAQNLLENANSIRLEDFPAPTANQRQVVVRLSAKANPETERNYKVELIPGKKAMVDCNRHGLNGAIEEKTVEGMGIKYYRFDTNGEIWSTRMGCPDNLQHEEFVAAKSLTVDYNSQVPLVVYIPRGYEIKYRIWAAGKLIDPNASSDGCKEINKSLYGEWKWVSSKGGYAGEETTSKKTGLNKTLILKKDGSYLEYGQGKLKASGTFKLTKGTSIFSNKVVPMIELSDNEKKMSYTFSGRDTLIISEECYDCYRHVYIRKK